MTYLQVGQTYIIQHSRLGEKIVKVHGADGFLYRVSDLQTGDELHISPKRIQSAELFSAEGEEKA
jgi:hypothetical protein